jgi:GTP-binding protein HflX
MVIVGDSDRIVIPDLGRQREQSARLRGLRLLHTHLGSNGITEEDLMDLVFLRLDSISVLTVNEEGGPQTFQWAHLMPYSSRNRLYHFSPHLPWDQVDIDFSREVEGLEKELARSDSEAFPSPDTERAILLSVDTKPKSLQENSLQELRELVHTAGLQVTETMIQRVSRVNPKHILGKGKLAELEILALQTSSSTLVFDRELTPAQIRHLSRITERKILDRTQVILDIFAQHASSRAGKLQVELAQLNYTLPRLSDTHRAFSRLSGGIGGRGPGETKLEMDRRRIAERKNKIKNELDKIRKNRAHTRQRRNSAGLPIVALVGYTNAGKSTLMNTLTNSGIHTADNLFATLDPTSRRLRFPKDREIILTDTVGFINYLPDNLKEAFLATLEELHSADLLVQVADAGHPELENQVRAVENILDGMGLGDTPRILALNKWDTVAPETRYPLGNLYPEGIPISAPDRSTLEPLIRHILRMLPPSSRKNREHSEGSSLQQAFP